MCSSGQDECIGKKLTVAKHHWLSVYAILTLKYKCSIDDIEHSLFMNIANYIINIK